MIEFPPWPDIPPEQCGEGTIPLRYQDVAQDGRLRLVALSPAVGAVVWQSVINKGPMAAAFRSAGNVPVLTRLVMEGGGGPISVASRLEGKGCMQLAHALGADGRLAKILLNMWVDVSGKRGRTHFPPPDRSGEPVAVGRIFAEHVFSRLFAAPEKRRVLELDVPGLPPVPPLRYEWHDPDELLTAPTGAEPLEPELSPVTLPTVFSLGDTDSNQHVNSLVYPRIFEEAAVRRFHALGISTRSLLMRGLNVAFRKPCFAGDAMRIRIQAFRSNGGYGATAALVPDTPVNGATPARPHCCARLWFSADPPA